MKKIYVVLVLISGFAYGQEAPGPRVLSGTARYKLTVSGDMGRGEDACGDIDGLKEIQLYDANNGNDFSKLWEGRMINESFSKTRDYHDDNRIVKVKLKKVIRWQIYTFPTGYSCDGGPDDRYNEVDITSGDFSFSLQAAGDGLSNLKVTSRPIVNLSSTNPDDNLLGTNTRLEIPAIAGVAPEYYKWQYHIDGEKVGSGIRRRDRWRLLPNQYQNLNYLTITACSNVLPREAVGKKIWLRANSYSPTLNFTYVQSAPHILSATGIPTSCSNTKDGKVRVVFDSALKQGESLYFSIKNKDIGDAPYSTKDITALEPDNSYVISFPDLKSYGGKGSYTIQILGRYNNGKGSEAILYSMDPEHSATFDISSPDPVDFSLTPINIRCKGGQDGQIKIKAWGGMDGGIYQFARKIPYTENSGGDEYTAWQSFVNDDKPTITDLSLGDYFIKVRKIKDGKICEALSGIGKSTISEPDSIVSLKYTQVLQPTHFGGTNGRIVAIIKGGTPKDDHSYWYEWINNDGTVQTTTTTEYKDGNSYIALNDIPSDTYKLTVWDKNYDSATQNGGCTVLNSSQFVGEPAQLKVSFEVLQGISCHAANEFGDETDFNPEGGDGQRDESQNGILQATVTGGVPLLVSQNNGLPYFYYWKKEQNGKWIPLDDADATAEHLSDGNYALNIEDKNGIRLGTYVNNILTPEIDSTYLMIQPPKLELRFEKQDVSCNISTNGRATAVVTGGTPDVSSGTPDYSYQWTNGASTPDISGLTAIGYSVIITDTNNCQVEGAVFINQPNDVQFNESITPPDCHQGDNGAITLSLTGGTEPYRFVWNTAEITPNLFHLKADTYSVTATDAQGCSYFKSFTLADPLPITINLGSDRTLCNGQSLDLDASIADSNSQYQWTGTNGYTSNEAKVNLTQAGIYTAKVTSSKGCEGEDTITIQTNNVAIDAEFFLSSQAYLDEEVILVNNSNPLGETTHWVIPEGVTIVEQKEDFIVLKFAAIGAYTISLQQTQGECYALYSKNINVEQRSTLSDSNGRNSASITDFTVTPNPSDGNFTVVVNLKNSSPVSLRIFAYNGQSPVLRRTASGEKNYKIDFNEQLAAGIYVLVLETAQQTIVKKIIIN